MKTIILTASLISTGFFFNSCKDDDQKRDSLALTGRILTDCEFKSPIKGVEIQLWNDKRVTKTGDTIPESMVASTVTDGDGNFSFIQDWDTFPRSLRSKKNNQNLIMAQGVFGNYALENTFNSSVADLLLNGNNANILFEIFRPDNWQTGDSLILKIAVPNVNAPYEKVFYDLPGTALDTLMNIRAFNRVMQFQSNKNELDRRFTFPAQIVWTVGGVTETRTYIVPTTTCSKELLVYSIHY